MYGLSDALVNQIIEAAQRFKCIRVVLFGSRARGDYRASSDIDLAVYGIAPRDELALRDALESLPTLLKFDIIPIRQETDAMLLQEIDKDGVVLMEERITKLQQLSQALERLKEAITEYDETHSAVVRDGTIWRFKFCTELAWKSCRERLLADGHVNIDSPKAAMRQAFTAGLVEDEQGWLALLQARNLTSHMYSEQQANEVYQGIVGKYAGLMTSLVEELHKQ